jgi:RimJ/RimL family protein N-acetyltransferase
MDDVRAALAGIWPLFGLTIRTPRLELKLPTDSQLVQLAQVAAAGVHDPGWSPIGRWSTLPSPQRERGLLQFHWNRRATWKPDDWHLPLAVCLNLSDHPIGVQELSAKDFGICGVAGTGSWLGQKYQGHGYGTEMRQAIAWFGFRVLGARALWSDCWQDNKPSKGVSDNLGYQVMFEGFYPRNRPDSEERYGDRTFEMRLLADRWNRPDYTIELTGNIERCRELFGL